MCQSCVGVYDNAESPNDISKIFFLSFRLTLVLPGHHQSNIFRKIETIGHASEKSQCQNFLRLGKNINLIREFQNDKPDLLRKRKVLNCFGHSRDEKCKLFEILDQDVTYHLCSNLQPKIQIKCERTLCFHEYLLHNPRTSFSYLGNTNKIKIKKSDEFSDKWLCFEICASVSSTAVDDITCASGHF